jgi:hypothetical protein
MHPQGSVLNLSSLETNLLPGDTSRIQKTELRLQYYEATNLKRFGARDDPAISRKEWSGRPDLNR